MEQSTWFDTVKLDDDTYIIRERLDVLTSHFGVGWVNCYLFVGKERAALVDTGMSLVPIRPLAERLAGGVPVLVINTHGHWDHVGGNPEFQEILAHPDEAARMNEGTPLPFVNEALRRDAELAERIGRSPDETIEVRATQPSGFIRGGDTIDLGGRTLEVLEVPGHSPRHLAILDRSGGYLVTGDSAYEGTMWAQIADGDPRAFVDSVKRLAALESVADLQVLPGHERSPIPGAELPDIADFLQKAYDGKAAWEPWETDPTVRKYSEGKLGVFMRAPEDR